MARALVTGCAGFIGSTLVERILADRGWEVTGIDSLTPYYDVGRKRKNLSSLRSSRFNFVEADLLDMDLVPLVRGMDFVFHLAAQPGVRGSWGSQFEIYTNHNVLATQRLLEASVDAGSLQAFIYASSSSVYGDALRYPTRETDPTIPMSPYGVTKLAGEHLGGLYAKNHGLPVRSLRFFTVYGPRQRPDMAFDRFIRAALRDSPIQVFGNGRQVREFTFVDDVVRALMRAAEVEIPGGVVINLSGGSAVSVLDVIEELQSLLGRRLDVEHLPKALGDVHRTGGSTEVARALLGWSPQVQLREGLSQQLSWISHGSG